MPAELVVANLNTHWGVDRRGRPYDLVRAVCELDADVTVLQEVWRPHDRRAVVDDLVAATGATLHEIAMMSDANPARPKGVRPAPGPAGTTGVAVLTRVPVVQRIDVDLGRARGDVIPRRYGIVVVVRVGDEHLAVGGMHASHRLWGSLPQVGRLDRALTETGRPSVLVGDLNMWGPPVQAVIRHRRRAVRGRTWPAHLPHSQIDHVWVDDRVEVLEGGVGPHVGSDHRPVRARLRVR